MTLRPTLADDTRQPDPHFHRLTSAFEPWLGTASAAKRRALARASPPLAAPLHQADRAQREQLKRLNSAHWNAQNAVDAALKRLQDAKAFARPLLEEALLLRYGLDLNAETTFLRLYMPKAGNAFSILAGAARTWTVSLLDAALHNFEPSEAREGAFEPASTFISQPSANGQFETLPAIRQRITVLTFTQLCRELDLGTRYQQHVREQLGLDEPVAAAVMRHKVQASQKAALRAALHLARLQGDIGEDFAQQVEGLIDNRAGLQVDGQPLRTYSVQMMDAPLTGLLLLAADLESPSRVQRLVAYVPDDPQHPLKEYPSALAFKQELTRQLRAADYQTFFSRFIDHAQRGVFFAGLSQRLARITWHPPQPGSGLAPWRVEPTDDPQLRFVATPISGDAWQYLYQRQLDKLLNDARTVAVSTADADRKARWALWDSFVNVAASILNVALLIAAPFIPGLGELMLGYMAYQLLDDVFEGVVDWAEGLQREAFTHLMSVLQSLVQMGAFVAGSRIAASELRKVLPPQARAFFERFKPVTLANGAQRYWQPDLSAYRQTEALPRHSYADRQGLHRARGETLLPLDDQLYAVQPVADSTDYVIKHPTRADAYTPTLRHNGSGAWLTELDQPLQWDRSTLLRRAGHHTQGLSANDQALALTLSGVDEAALRKMHVNREPLPPLLEDNLLRLRIDRDLHTLIERLDSDDPAQHARIDPQDELQLLVSYGNWPANRALRLINAEGEVVWAFGGEQLPTVQIHEAQLDSGQLLKAVLHSLSPEEIRTQFGERASDPQLSVDTRVTLLRKKLAHTARRNLAALFDSRYGSLPRVDSPPAQRLQQTAPQLPAGVITRLLEHASGEELQALDDQRLPERLTDHARAAQAHLQVNRAYEGLHLDSVQNLDSERLALNSLKLLPGWSPRLRLEARHLTREGERWLHVGPDDASVHRTLVRTGEGRYVPYDDKGALSGETDLYDAVLHALPDTERRALRLNLHQGAELKQRLRQQAWPRATIRTLLSDPIAPEPARETLRLLGSDTGYRAQPPGADGPASLIQRARALYPLISNAQLDGLLDHLNTQPDGATNGLARLETEYHTLNRNLLTWQSQAPSARPRNGGPLTLRQQYYEQRNRQLFADQLRACWRRETEVDAYYEDPLRDGHILRLEYPVIGALPELTANFEHVSFLSLSGTAHTNATLAFLRHFPRVRHLAIHGIALGDLPPDLHRLAHLNTLSLSHCQISLSAASQARLGAMSRLQTLALNGNPLGRVPSVEALHDLVVLDLSNTGIDQLPAGVLTRNHLQAALLSDNRISELPAQLFNLSPLSSRNFDLSGNPLSRASLEQVKHYFQRYNTYWEVDAPEVDRRDAALLYPTLNANSLNRLIYALPGDIEAGHIELARRTGEARVLKTELDQWEQTPQLSLAEYARRSALRQLLEDTWHRIPPSDTEYAQSLTLPRSLAGELPTTRATFPHIASLVVEGNGQASNLVSLLGNLPNLDILDIEAVPLGDIPPQAFDLPQLTYLGLTHCAITLSESSRLSLERMTGLHYLDLSHNPLGQTPDFSPLPDLYGVVLQNTGLTTLPAGLLDSAARGSVNLSYNAIEQLPEATFNLPSEHVKGLDLSRNPLSRQTLEQIKRYCQRTHEDLNADAPAAEHAHARRLYPSFSDSEADHFIFSLPGDMDAVAPTLQRLEAEYAQLVTDLQQWMLNVPTRHPILGIDLDEATRALEQLNRDRNKTLIEQAWRRESPEDEESLEDERSHALTLERPILGALPPLQARFNHITAFELHGGGTLTNVDGLLNCMPQLQTLTLNQCALRRLPTALFAMPQLANLDMSACEIHLDAVSARTLSELTALEFLDLSNNPLEHAPDISGLAQLVSLHLRDCQLREVPNGVFQLSQLQTLDLSHNQLHTLPADLMEFSATFHDDSDFSDNPWSADSVNILRQYYQRTGTGFQVPTATVNALGEPLQTPHPLPMEE
jgi:Leucine-rich repeat (LRR) protein